MSGIGKRMRYYKHRNSKLKYYLDSTSTYIGPKFMSNIKMNRLKSLVDQMNEAERKVILDRVEHYNKLSENMYIDRFRDASMEMYPIRDLRLNAVFNGVRSSSTYIFDTYKYLRHFDPEYKAGFLFGDITHIPEIPCFVKSRPILGVNAHSVLLPLNHVRHFTFLTDRRKFADKKNMLVGRAFVDQPHRRRFWELYFKHPMCNLGSINPGEKENPEWLVDPMPIDDHLEYKFILCIEGNDVASNLKWVMSSNSLAVMPKPTYETWFMEGKLIPNVHYVEIKPDFSDLEERLQYYINYPKKAQDIIENANAYVASFRSHKHEELIGFLVAKKYFENTGQILKS